MNWINIKKRIPPERVIVDLWTDEGRLTDYILNANYNGVKGNNFFTPQKGGPSCVRFNGSQYFTQATHWMYPPKPPRDK